MAENKIPDSEVQEKETKLVVENTDDGSTVMIEDKTVKNKTNDQVEEDKIVDQDIERNKIDDKDEDKNNTVGVKTNDKDEIEESKIDDKDKVEGDIDYKDEGKIEDNDKKEEEIKDDIKEEKDITEEPPSYDISLDVMQDEVTKAEELITPITPITYTPFLTDDIIIEIKVMNERCILLTDEIQQLKREVSELSQKPELTEEDMQMIEKKQDVLMSKVAELEQITQKFQKAREEVDKMEKVEVKKRDVEPFKKILEEDRFEIPQIQYPEDKLPRIIVCGYTDVLPKLVVADTEQKGREKCFEKLTGKLTESLTMQEKLVKENAQLEGGKYKLEEALLEKDTALESLQKKVCGLQAEMRIIVKENMELSRQLATLNQLVIRPTCYYTSSGVTPSPPSTSPILSSRPHACGQLQDDAYCRCKCCFRSPFTDTLSPTTETACSKNNCHNI